MPGIEWIEVTPVPATTTFLTLELVDVANYLDQIVLVEDCVVQYVKDKATNEIVMYVGPTADELVEVNRWTTG